MEKSHTSGKVAAAATESEMTPSNTTVMMMKATQKATKNKFLKILLPLFQNHRICNAIVEITPCCRFWQRIVILLDNVHCMTVHSEGMSKCGGLFVVHQKSYHAGQFNLWLMMDHDLLPPFNIFQE